MSPAGRVPLLRDGRYVRICLVGWFTGVVRWPELLAYGIWAFEVTGSPVLVPTIALVRFVPLAVLSLFIGPAADQLSPQRLLSAAVAGATLVNGAMWAVAAIGALAYWHLVPADPGLGPVISNIWNFPFVSMVPVIGAAALDLSPAMIGYASSLEGLTALIGISLIARLAQPRWLRTPGPERRLTECAAGVGLRARSGRRAAGRRFCSRRSPAGPLARAASP